jgi:O-antigen ligase
MSLSRSAMLALAVSVPLLLLTWPPSRRLGTFLVLAVGLVGMRFAVPGLLGTIKSLFVHIRSDPSFQGRTDDYAVVGRFIARSPVFGRGFGTFDPNRYVLLDNQYLGTLIETGVVGVLALFLLFSAGVACALAAARRAVDPDGRDLAHALTASIVATVASFATYDALAFPMATMVTFLILGCSGALWRLSGGRE